MHTTAQTFTSYRRNLCGQALDMCREIYTAAGCDAAECVRAHLFEGGHKFHGGESLPWLAETLEARPGLVVKL